MSLLQLGLFWLVMHAQPNQETAMAVGTTSAARVARSPRATGAQPYSEV